MSKRKLSEFAETPSYEAQGSSIELRRQRAAEKIHHGKKVLQRSLKVAKGFERQKLSRRQKNASAKRDSSEVARLDSEVEALKNLDLLSSAQVYLFKALSKVKQIKASPSLPEFVSISEKPAVDLPTANVRARLYNSKPVKQAIPDILASIGKALGVGDSVRSKGSARQQNLDALVDGKQAANSEVEDDTIHGSPGLKEDNSFSNSNSDKSVGEVEDEDRSWRNYDSRVAAPSDENSLDEQNSQDEASISSEQEDDRQLTTRLSSLSSSPVPEDRQTRKPAPPKSNSTFLPSLTMGGYWSGSGSEPEDDIPETAPRKNRRGQRARQQIWEKKFGSKAKHLQKPVRESRDDGWNLRKGAQDSQGQHWRGAKGSFDGERNRLYVRRGTAGAGDGHRQAPSDGRHKAAAGADLHPSWKAAKKAKEQKVGAEFAGKKVVFD